MAFFRPAPKTPRDPKQEARARRMLQAIGPGVSLSPYEMQLVDGLKTDDTATDIFCRVMDKVRVYEAVKERTPRLTRAEIVEIARRSTLEAVETTAEIFLQTLQESTATAERAALEVPETAAHVVLHGIQAYRTAVQLAAIGHTDAPQATPGAAEAPETDSGT